MKTVINPLNRINRLIDAAAAKAGSDYKLAQHLGQDDMQTAINANLS